MEGRGKSRRRSPYRVWKRRGSALLAVLLTLSLMLGDISGLSRVVMAGQGTVREEFRIHREDILKAAEEAIENGEPLSEPLAITSEEEKTEEKYQEILPADGSVYEIFPDIEQVKEVDSLELRIFIRLAEGADPASYTLTGDETLVFLYVNGGDVTAEGRVNIDGYVSEFTEVAAFESEEEPMQPRGDTGAVPGNGAAGSGKGSGNGAAGGSGTAGSEAVGSSDAENDTAAAESESNGSDSMDPEDSAADLDGETEAESEEVGNGTSEDGMSPEETLPTETQEPSQEPESGAAEETEAAEQPSGETPDDETPGDQTDGSEADGTASDENTAEAGTGSADEDKETAGNTENSDAADDSADNENDVKESDAADEASEADEGSAEDNSQADPADTENENAEVDKEDGAEPEKSDTAENADSNAADADNEAGSTVTLSLRNIQKVAASLASPSEAETPEADESQEEQEETEADEEDSYYEDNGDPVDEEDAAETEDEEDIFKKTHDLKGRKYDEAVLDETVTVRAFAAGMEDAGFNREDLLEGAHQLTYTVAEGEARLIYTPEYVRDEAVVTFGIVPAEGMEVYQVTANGDVLAETEITAAIASASEVRRAAKAASESEAGYDEERAVYYQIPQVLEDQTVEIQVVEEGYNSHPAFRKSKTFDNGVTVTVSAEEGILPAGTELQVEEVTVQIQDALKEKVENEAEDNTAVTSVIAYDINLVLDGEKLDNSWSENGYVDVTFSGTRIEEMTDNANKIEVVAVDDNQQEVLSAKNADAVTAETVELESIHNQDVEGTIIDEVSFEVGHFSIYAMVGVGEGEKVYNSYTMNIGQSLTLRHQAEYNRESRGDWSSNDNTNAVVKVSVSGDQANVEAVGQGTAIITYSYKYLDRWQWQSASETFEITVLDSDAFRINWYVNGVLVDTTYALEGERPVYSGSTPNRTGTGCTDGEIDFAGWATQPNSKTFYNVDNLPAVTGDTNYYAIFKTKTYFYFVLPGKSNTSIVPEDYMYAGDGEIIVPDGYERGNGEASNRWYSSRYPISDYIIEGPEDSEIRTGLRTYYNGQNGKDQYEERWTYTVNWTTLSTAGPSVGYDYTNISGNTNFHIDGAITIDTREKVTFLYNVTMPNGYVTSQSTLHGMGDRVQINSTVTENGKFLTDGYEYEAVISHEGVNYVFDGWYEDDGFSIKAYVEYTASESKRFYAKYVPDSESVIVKKILDDYDLFPNSEVSQVSFRLVETDSNWELKEDGVVQEISIKASEGETGSGSSEEIMIEARDAYYLLTEMTTADGYLRIEKAIKLKSTLQEDGTLRLTCENEPSDGLDGQVSIESGKNHFVISVTNYPISVAELPETGGPGLIMMERFGWMLLLLALAGAEVQLFSRRRRKEQ